jgi:bifunctional pyridoxal-dependent enzyme with beta-cystathionase and maltose regulon repressor activities
MPFPTHCQLLTIACVDGLEHMFTLRAKVKIILAQPPTYENYDNYLVPSLQAAYDFSPEKSRIKAVLVCNPHNPTSRCYRKDALLELMEFCQERGLHLISDEVYALTDLHGVSNKAPKFVSALSLTEPLVPEGAVKVDPSRVHVVWSASKLFGISGFRVVRLPIRYRLSKPVCQRRLTRTGLSYLPTKSSAISYSLPPHLLSH